MKVRTQLEVKRKSGQYIGAFAVYGYLKDETDKNRLDGRRVRRRRCAGYLQMEAGGHEPAGIAAD